MLIATSTAQDGNGTLSLYAIDRNNDNNHGSLYRRNVTNSSGLNPAYVTFDNRGNYALVANYGAGDQNSTGQSVAVFPVNHSDFAFERPTSVSFHTGNSTNPDRQAGPHPHMFTTDPFANAFAFSPDLGTDQVYQYKFNASSGVLAAATAPYVSPDMSGSGPRHIAFHPDRLFAYVINELANTIDVFTYDSQAGQLTALVQSISTLPDGFSGSSEAAEILVTPNGKYVYASNRGYDSIVGYYVNPLSTDFHLKRISFTTERISTPRNFAIDPNGRFLLVGCSTTNEIVTFDILNDGFLVWNGALTSMAGAISIQLNEYD
jgi:6-phosphogluconolactonase